MRTTPWNRRSARHPRSTRTVVSAAALRCAAQWRWPVLPGAGLRPHAGRTAGAGLRGPDQGGGAPDTPCACLRPGCPVPAAHPHDPPLLAATTDPAMVRWWWRARPTAPLLVATGGRVSAVSLPLAAGREALRRLERLDVSLGPVVADPGRLVLLVRPYSLEQLGELLNGYEWVPSSVRFHGEGGYVVLPPSRVGAGRVAWEHRPRPADPQAPGSAPWLPSAGTLLELLVEAGRTSPDGQRLTH